MIHQYDRGDSSSPKRFRTFIFMNMRMKPVISILFYERDHWFKSFHVIRYSLSYKLMVLKITFSCLFVKSPVFILVIHKPLESLSKTDNRLFVQLSLSFFLDCYGRSYKKTSCDVKTYIFRYQPVWWLERSYSGYELRIKINWNN